MIRHSRASGMALAVALAVAPATAQAPAPVGIAAAVLNRVTIARGGSAQMRPAMLRQQVAMADRVETGARSQLQLLLLDRSTFTVGANARLTIDRFVYDPAQGRSMSATVAKGAFRFMSGRPGRGGTSTIATPVASIGIRGTIVDGLVGSDAIAVASGERGFGGGRNADPANATLVILRGPGARTQGNVQPGAITIAAGGKTVALERPLQAVFVPRAGAQPIGPVSISLQGLNRVQNLIFPALADWRLATLPAPRGSTPMPMPQRRARPVPVLVGDPYSGEPDGGAGVPSYGAGIPSLPGIPRGIRNETPQSPPARTTRTQTGQVPQGDTPPPPPSTSRPPEPEPAPPPVEEAPKQAPEPTPTAYEPEPQPAPPPRTASPPPAPEPQYEPDSAPTSEPPPPPIPRAPRQTGPNYPPGQGDDIKSGQTTSNY